MRSVLCCAAVALVGLALAGCSSQTSETTFYDPDYPLYADASELCAAADVVVIGHALSDDVREVDLADAGPAVTVMTVTQFEVTDVVAGTALHPGDVIEVGQAGGHFEGNDYLADQYELSGGDDHLLFLALYPATPAALVSPAQGGYAVTGSAEFEPSELNPTPGMLRDVPRDQLCAAG